MNWTSAAPAILAAFLASAVEIVEAFTIILAVSTLRGWRPALNGTAAGLAILAVLVIVLGPVLATIRLDLLQLGIGLLLLLFGLRWLRKAILRAAGIIPLHDETKIFAKEKATLARKEEARAAGLDWIAGLAAMKAVLIEGLEVVFIVIAVGAGQGLLLPAAFGALAACILVLCVGMLIRQPLSRVPENTLKFLVGIMLSAFGIYWTGEGLGVAWPGNDLMLAALIGMFLAAALLLVAALRRPLGKAA